MAEGISSFGITVEDPGMLYRLATQGQSPRAYPLEYPVGVLTKGEGVFSEMWTVLRLPNKDYFQLGLYAFYADPLYGIWSFMQSATLDRKLQEKYPQALTFSLSGQDGVSEGIRNPAAGTYYMAKLGWRSERMQWFRELKIVDQALRQEAYPPHLRDILERRLDELTKISEVSSVIMFATTGVSANPFRVDRTEPFLLESSDKFVQVVERWRSFAIHTVEAISEVKGIPQRGRLII